MRLPLSRLPTSWSRSIRPGGANSAKAVAILAIAVGVASGFADAKDNPACDQFDWSIKRELQLFADPDLEMVFSGATLSSIPEKGLVVELQPHGTLDLCAGPGARAEIGRRLRRAAFCRRMSRSGGAYQVTLSGDAWIDLIQDGKAIALSAETINPNCSDARKSMRFRLEQGPLTVQVTGAASSQIRLAILPVE